MSIDELALPAHLGGTTAQGLSRGHPVAQFELGAHRNFVYLVLDWDEKRAAWIDPQQEVGPVLEVLGSEGFTLDHVLLTHTHFDHVAGVPELARRYPEARIRVHPGDRHRLDAALPCAPVADGEVLRVGVLPLTVLHTPGHSAGECSFLLHADRPYLFTGDAVFIRDCGRTDLETGSSQQMFDSLRRLRGLPLTTVILPGHHYRPECASTLKCELEESAPFRCRSVAELEALP